MSIRNRITWAGMDLADGILDRLSEHRRWQIVDFLMRRSWMDICRVDGYFWAANPGENSLFDLGGCSMCSTDAYCYCGKERA